MQQSSLDILADLLQRYVGEIGRSAHSYAEVCNRGAPSAEDLVGLLLFWRWHSINSLWDPAEAEDVSYSYRCSACYVRRCWSADPCRAAANQDVCCGTRTLEVGRCSGYSDRLRWRNFSLPQLRAKGLAQEPAPPAVELAGIEPCAGKNGQPIPEPCRVDCAALGATNAARLRGWNGDAGDGTEGHGGGPPGCSQLHPRPGMHGSVLPPPPPQCIACTRRQSNTAEQRGWSSGLPASPYQARWFVRRWRAKADMPAYGELILADIRRPPAAAAYDSLWLPVSSSTEHILRLAPFQLQGACVREDWTHKSVMIASRGAIHHSTVFTERSTPCAPPQVQAEDPFAHVLPAYPVRRTPNWPPSFQQKGEVHSRLLLLTPRALGFRTPRPTMRPPRRQLTMSHLD